MCARALGSLAIDRRHGLDGARHAGRHQRHEVLRPRRGGIRIEHAHASHERGHDHADHHDDHARIGGGPCRTRTVHHHTRRIGRLGEIGR